MKGKKTLEERKNDPIEFPKRESGFIPTLIYISNRRILIQKIPDGGLFTGDVIKDVEDKFPHRSLESFIDHGCFPEERGQNRVIFFLLSRMLPGRFRLLHETDGRALHDLRAFEGFIREDKTIHVVAIPAGRVQNESVGIGVFAGDRGGFDIFQRFLLENVLAVGMALILDKNLYDNHRCSNSNNFHESVILDGSVKVVIPAQAGIQNW
jgi:hypothetical protein